MKVLRNNYNYNTNIDEESKQIVEPYPRQTICENCGSELEYDESDLNMGVYGCMHLLCPLCGCNNMLEDNENSITLTKDNIQFPIHFWHTCKENGAVDCCDNDHVREYINKAIDYFRTHKDEYDYGGYITGNLYLSVHRYSGDEVYEVIVSNNFYHMEIPFEKEDY